MARITDEILRKIMPHAPARVRAAELPLLNFAAYRYQINTRRRLACWLANLAEESGELRYQEELASGSDYEGRDDLGNTQPGDGVRYKGRGRIQGTGRDVYAKYTAYLKDHADAAVPFVDLVKYPRKLAQAPYSTDFAGWFVNGYKHLLDEADAGNFLAFSIGINGRMRKTGKPRNWDVRQAYYTTALRAIPDGWTLDDDVEEITQSHVDESIVQSLDNESGYPDYDVNAGSTASSEPEARPTPSSEASNGSEGRKTSAISIPVTDEVPSGAAPDATTRDKDLSPQVVDRERPSLFHKVMTGAMATVASAIAAVTSTCGGNEIANSVGQKAADRVSDLPGNQLAHIGIVVLYIAIGLAASILILWIASVFYERAAARASARTTEKMRIAADPNLNTVELKK